MLSSFNTDRLRGLGFATPVLQRLFRRALSQMWNMAWRSASTPSYQEELNVVSRGQRTPEGRKAGGRIFFLNFHLFDLKFIVFWTEFI